MGESDVAKLLLQAVYEIFGDIEKYQKAKDDQLKKLQMQSKQLDAKEAEAQSKYSLLHLILECTFLDEGDSDEEFAHGFMACHRLSHSSLKRCLRNARDEDDFEGVGLFRSCSFARKKVGVFGVLEEQKVSKYYAVSSLVKYPFDSNYPALVRKMESFCIKNGVSESDAAYYIKNLVKTGSLPEGSNISNAFEQFLMIFTYHLFGVEAVRHPAALIHHAMAINLIELGIDIDFKDALLIAPMSIAGAMPVCRYCYNIFSRKKIQASIAMIKLLQVCRAQTIQTLRDI